MKILDEFKDELVFVLPESMSLATHFFSLINQ